MYLFSKEHNLQMKEFLGTNFSRGLLIASCLHYLCRPCDKEDIYLQSPLLSPNTDKLQFTLHEDDTVLDKVIDIRQEECCI